TTAEDPVEAVIPGVAQVQCKEGGVTFFMALKAFLHRSRVTAGIFLRRKVPWGFLSLFFYLYQNLPISNKIFSYTE
ncbi:hypothetical protein ACFL35_05470, partial [Candidatus Riflebacteria bacterium]